GNFSPERPRAPSEGGTEVASPVTIVDPEGCPRARPAGRPTHPYPVRISSTVTPHLNHGRQVGCEPRGEGGVGARNVPAWQLMSSFDRETATHSVGGLTGTIGILRIEHSETLTSCNSFVAQFTYGVSVSDLSPPCATGRAVPLRRAELGTRPSRRP